MLFGFAAAVKIWALVPLGITGLLLVAATQCPPMVDSLGTLFAMTSGQSSNAAAAVLRPVAELWQGDLERAGYVWFTSGAAAQIPWNRQLYGYFRSHFRLIGLAAPHWSSRSVPRPGLYVRTPRTT